MEQTINTEALLEWYIDSGVDATVGETACLTQEQATQPVETSPAILKQAPISPTLRTAITPLAQANFEACLNARRLCDRAQTLDELRQAIEKFDGCALKFNASSTVFGIGPIHAPILIVGEAPGSDEDRIGQPFVGRCGQLLNKMLASIGVQREEVYITNVVPWRPPGNRTPTDSEVAVCLPFLKRQIALVAPKIILLLGGSALKALLDNTDPISRTRGHWLEYKAPNQDPVPVLPTYHPSYLLREPSQKAKSWSDFLRIAKKLKEN